MEVLHVLLLLILNHVIHVTVLLIVNVVAGLVGKCVIDLVVVVIVNELVVLPECLPMAALHVLKRLTVKNVITILVLLIVY